MEEFTGLGVPEDLAARAAGLLDTFSLLDVVEIATAEKLPAEEVAGVYFAVSERIEVDQMLTRITQLPRDDRWTALARSALRYDLYAALAGLTSNVLTSTSSTDSPAQRIEAWEEANEEARGPGPGHLRGDHCLGHVRPRDAVGRPADDPHPAPLLTVTPPRIATFRPDTPSLRSACLRGTSQSEGVGSAEHAGDCGHCPLDVRVGEVGAGGEPQPGDAVGHRRRAEAPDAYALGQQCRRLPSTARPGSPTRTETTAPSGRVAGRSRASSPSASWSARARTAAASPGSARRTLSAALGSGRGCAVPARCRR